MSTWDDAAEWYLAMVNDPTSGFNHLAIDLVVDMLGPVAGVTVLDIGSGDGALARHLARGGALVTATEPTAALHAAATTADAAEPLGIRHLTNRAEQLVDIDDATTDCAVALLVLHHVADLDHAIHELHRVLRPGGRAVVVIPHPATDHPGAAWHPTPTGPRRLMGDYDTETYWQTDETNTIRAIGWHHRTTATWITTFARHGFIVDELREPTGTDPRRPDRGGPWADVPRFLALRLRKPAERADPR